ncbi:TPR-like protein [Wallemia mellicola]|uniref:TPR-like protein n=1 Tax=Wallemia mellicola TaxID=1708541 RepID=A0A4T0Q569_9BASI|nr:TPR-like protein [Wallemia mellicola]TIC18354.1 TPR-like protein [Wallemia mellicola]TIC50946.1 TPR-like protein [Wallemia mellicola]TIC71319.1 TPR-like protein [Wallemia mellicola]
MYRFSAITRNLSRSITTRQFNRPLITKPLFGYRWASTSGASSTVDPAESEAFEEMEEGTRLLNEGDLEKAKEHYERSLNIRTTAMGLFNLGVTQFYSKDIPAAIQTWEQSIKLYPSNADAHTNIASAHILSSPSNPEKALHHLQRAKHLSPEDGEIVFNLLTTFSAGHLESALENYQKAKSLGVERAKENVRNVGAKIISEKAKSADEQK